MTQTFDLTRSTLVPTQAKNNKRLSSSNWSYHHCSLPPFPLPWHSLEEIHPVESFPKFKEHQDEEAPDLDPDLPIPSIEESDETLYQASQLTSSLTLPDESSSPESTPITSPTTSLSFLSILEPAFFTPTSNPPWNPMSSSKPTKLHIGVSDACESSYKTATEWLNAVSSTS